MGGLLKCPTCRYELPDSGGTCPECGSSWIREELIMAAAQRSRPAVPGLVWELRLAAVGGSLTVLGIVACMVMAGRYGFSLIVYLLLGAGHASACWYLASRARPRGRARAVPGWARSSFAHVLGVLLLLLGFTGAIITGLLILAFFSFFVLGDNP